MGFSPKSNSDCDKGKGADVNLFRFNVVLFFSLLINNKIIFFFSSFDLSKGEVRFEYEVGRMKD